MRILFIGDIYGSKGIEAVLENTKAIIDKYEIDLVIANAENTTYGKGLSLQDYKKLSNAGIQYFTMGNHTWDQNDYKEVLSQKNIIRPFNISNNYEQSEIGKGTIEFTFKNKKIRITNVIGHEGIKLFRLYKNKHDSKNVTDEEYNKDSVQTNPFIEFNNILKKDDSDIHIVDYHTEFTAEKNAFLREFAGKVEAILGTHTHVQTNDAVIYKQTAYITDVGMTGPSEGIIGADPEDILLHHRGLKERYKCVDSNSSYQFNAVVLEFDDKTNKPIKIELIRILEKSDEEKPFKWLF